MAPDLRRPETPVENPSVRGEIRAPRLGQRLRRTIPYWLARHLGAPTPLQASVLIRVDTRDDGPKVGMGCVIYRNSGDAFVLTANHVVDEAVTVRVDGIDAKVLAPGNDAFDLAIITAKIPNPALDLRRWWLRDNAPCTVFGCKPAANKIRELVPVDCTVDREGLLLPDSDAPVTEGPTPRAQSFNVTSKAGELKPGYSGAAVLARRTRALVGVYIQGAKVGKGVVVSAAALPYVWNSIPPFIGRKLRPKSLLRVLVPWIVLGALLAINVGPYVWRALRPSPSIGYAQQCKGCGIPFTRKNWTIAGNCKVVEPVDPESGQLDIKGNCVALSSLSPFVRTSFEFVVEFQALGSPLSWLVGIRPKQVDGINQIDGYQFEIDPSHRVGYLPTIAGRRVFPERWWNLLELLFSQPTPMTPELKAHEDSCSNADSFFIVTDVLDDQIVTKISAANYGHCYRQIAWTIPASPIAGSGNVGWVADINTRASLSEFQVNPLRDKSDAK